MRILQCKWDVTITKMIKQLGAKPTIIIDNFDRGAYKDEIEAHPDFKKINVGTFESLESVMNLAGEITHQDLKFDYIINLTYEGGQFGAGVLANALKIPGYGINEMLAHRDKRYMKSLIAAQNIPVAKFYSIYDFNKENLLEEIINNLQFPMIAKPVSQGGMRGVKKILDEHELVAWLDVKRLEISQQSNRPHFMIEEFLEGEEYHVDSIWDEGKPCYTFVGKYQNKMIELTNGSLGGNYYLRNSEESELVKKLTILNEKVGKTLGIKKGITHTEFYQQPDGTFWFGECASRSGGGPLDECIRLMYGEGLKQLAVRAILGDFKNAPNPHAIPDKISGAINLRPLSNGKIMTMPSAEELHSINGVAQVKYFKKVGDFIHAGGSSDWCVLAYVLCESRDTLNESLNLLKQKAQFITEEIHS